jgi:hypothetical protein
VLGVVALPLPALANTSEIPTENMNDTDRESRPAENAAGKTQLKNQDDSEETVGVIVKIEDNEVPTGLNFLKEALKQAPPPALLNFILAAICALLVIVIPVKYLVNRKRKIVVEQQQKPINKLMLRWCYIAIVILAAVSVYLAFNVDLNEKMKPTNALTIWQAITCGISIVLAITIVPKIEAPRNA